MVEFSSIWLGLVKRPIVAKENLSPRRQRALLLWKLESSYCLKQNCAIEPLYF